MSVTIAGVEPGSPAARSGIVAGHRLERINGHAIADVLDYRFYMTEKSLRLDLCDPAGNAYSIPLRKGEYTDLGLVFDTYLMDSEKSCRNQCCFCFIDQMPPGLRESLYFKDDDTRLGFLFGNYDTLTNLADADIDRLITMRISPINVSVHTTNPELRVRMMKNPRAGEVLTYLPRLCEAGIQVNAQLVLCPGLNDGAELERSLRDLARLGPHLQSVSVVPVGLTKHRAGLSPLRLFDEKEAAAVLDTVTRYGDRQLAGTGNRTFFAADEFYLKAKVPLPADSFYEEYYQLENGVGMTTLLAHEFAQALETMPPAPTRRRVTLATGTAAAPLMKDLAAKAMERFPGLAVEVVAIENRFFGESITVAGLVTGGDLIAQLRERDLGEEVLFPATMLRHDGDKFLDDVTVEAVAEALGVPVTPVEVEGVDLLETMLRSS
jgi:putative radical SAM enzyme (TIGR03279 family)